MDPFQANPPAPDADESGAAFGRYTLERLLGEGAMGAVYLALDTTLGRRVALKIPKFAADDADGRARFLREARLAASLHHSHICPIHDIGEHDGWLYLTMAFIEGRTLDAYVAPGQPQRQTAILVRKLALALAEAHEAGVVHRDLKPANIMIDKKGEPIVMDFGLARAEGDGARVTQSGVIIGSPAYMAPEQAEGDPARVGPQSDIYSLGVVLFELLTGRLPFEGNMIAVLAALVTKDVPSPRDHRPDVDPALEFICRRMTAKRPADRHETMRDVADALRAYLADPSKANAAAEVLVAPAARVASPNAVPVDLAGVSRAAMHADLAPDDENQAKPIVQPTTRSAAGSPATHAPARNSTDTREAGGTPARIRGARPTPDVARERNDKTKPTTAPERGEEFDALPVAPPPRRRPADSTSRAADSTRRAAGARRGRSATTPTGSSDPWFKAIGLAAGAMVGIVVLGLVLANRTKRDAGPAPAPSTNQTAVGDPEVIPVPPTPPGSAPLTAGTKAGQLWDGNGLKIKFCWCPDTNGTFLMGSPRDEKDRSNDEEQVSVTLTGFWLAKHEVTQSEWQSVLSTSLAAQRDKADKSYKLYGEGPTHPMYYVSHDEATEFAKKYTQQERAAGRLPAGWEYRLPTEAQWEYGCRARTKTATAFGDKLDSRAANFDGNHPYNGADKGPYLETTTEVGRYAANAWGLCDMHGNVWEWCRDWFADTLPGGKDPEVSKNVRNRVHRGSSWFCVGVMCRSAYRSTFDPTRRDRRLGFRLAAVRVANSSRNLDPFSSTPVNTAPSQPSPRPAVLTSATTGMKLVLITNGEYQRGSPASDTAASSDEKPRHTVRLTREFYLGRYEVTQGEWKAVMNTEPWKGQSFVKEGQDYAATYVSWDDAQAFCRKLSQRDGATYRLPTEAEWEYACRAGTTTRYSFGDDESKLGEYAWYDKNAYDIGEQYAHQVGQKKPNPFGLFDMHGNVWEWCQDRYDEKEYATHAGRAVQDPHGPQSGSLRVRRGGSWSSRPAGARSSFRYGNTPGYRSNDLGFRVASGPSGK